MSVHKLQVTISGQSLLPEDAMVNTWYFEGSGSDPENVVDMVWDFYCEEPTGISGSITEYITTQVVNAATTWKLYDLSDPEPRAPVYEESRPLTGLTSGAGLPSEVALCFSYHAAPLSGVPAARRRGRVYLGGFVASANVTGRPAGALIDTMAAAGRDLIQASNASVSWQWQQYSQTTETGHVVTGGWIDNSWDTQRRRGLASSSRDTFTGGTP